MEVKPRIGTRSLILIAEAMAGGQTGLARDAVSRLQFWMIGPSNIDFSAIEQELTASSTMLPKSGWIWHKYAREERSRTHSPRLRNAPRA